MSSMHGIGEQIVYIVVTSREAEVERGAPVQHKVTFTGIVHLERYSLSIMLLNRET
jgi:hypothetical protein